MKHKYLFMTIASFIFLIWGVQQPVKAQLYINEFMASNDTAVPGPQGDYPDWIEIYNAGDEDVMLGGYYMADDLTDPEAMYQIPDTYPDSVTVPAGGYLIFYANKGQESSVLNLNFKLSGSGEEIGLWNPSQQLLDSIVYNEQTTDVSYGRYPDGTGNWAFMTRFTPGAPNINPNPPAIRLYINEFMASNDFALPGPQGDYPDWIEIYNAGDEAVMLGGYYMADDLTDPTARHQIPDTYPDSVTVPAGGYLVFYANKGQESSVLNLNFKLSGSGEQIGLWDPEQNIIDSLTYGPQITDTSYGRFPDGANIWYFMPDYSPGEANRYTSDIKENSEHIKQVKNYPNPFSSITQIEFTLSQPDRVVVTVYSVTGAEVAQLADKTFNSGRHTIMWDASLLPQGTYFYHIQTSDGIQVKKATLIR